MRRAARNRDVPSNGKLTSNAPETTLALLPPMAEIQDILISGILPGGGKHGYTFETSKPEAPLNHMRFGGRDIATRIPFREQPTPEAVFHVERGLYAGVIYTHFGHFIDECIHRLYARYLIPELLDMPVYFHARLNKPLAVPEWAYVILSRLGISRDDVHLIDGPTHFERLVIPPQGRLLAGATVLPDYNSYFPPRKEPRKASRRTPKKIYLTRALHRATGSFFGESYIERLLTEAGFQVIAPEHEPLDAMIEILQNAEQLVFSEGSAIHILELAAPIRARVFVIGRRVGTRNRFLPLLQELCSDAAVSLHLRAPFLLFGDQAERSLKSSRGCNFIDLEAVVKDLAAFFGVELPWSADQARIAIRADLIDYLLHPATLPKPMDAAILGDHLLYLRELAKSLDI